MNDDHFKPAEGVTIANALEYAEAIDQATRRDVKVIPKGERALSISVIAASLRLISDQLLKTRDYMIQTGKADPLSEEQLLMIKMIFRRAREKGEN